VLLLNTARVLITLIGLIILDAMRVAYGLSGVPLLLVLTIVMLVVFVVADVAEDALVAHFNKDDSVA